jgi:MFS family permease
VFVWTQSHSTHPTIDVSLFKNRAFSAGAFSVAMAFFALQGATFYLAYYLQAIRGYTPLNAGIALIAVAAAVMISAPASARLSSRVGPGVVAGSGLAIFGVALASYGLATQTMPVVFVELILAGTGLGMGLTMSPATNAIMNAVPREKAGAGAAVNNTVRQVAGALGVAILGSILAVSFRSDLGSNTPREVAAQLDSLGAASSSQLPPQERVSTYVSKDTSQSIGNALDFVGQATRVLQERVSSTNLPPAQRAELQARAQADLKKFVDATRSSFMSAMHITSVIGGLMAFLGAFVAWRYLPGRAEFGEVNGPGPPPADAAAAPTADGEHRPQHLDATALPVPEHAEHEPQHLDGSSRTRP